MNVEYELESDDLAAFVIAGRKSPQGRRQIRAEFATALFPVFSALVVVVIVLIYQGAPPFAYVMFVLVPFLVSVAVWSAWYRYLQSVVLQFRTNPPSRVGLGHHTLNVGEAGLRESQPYGESRHSWSVVSEVHETPHHFFITVLPSGTYIVPKRAFATADGLTVFRDRLSANIPTKTPATTAG